MNSYRVRNNIAVSAVSGLLLAYTVCFYLVDYYSFLAGIGSNVNVFALAGLFLGFSTVFFVTFHIFGKVRREAILISLFLFGFSGTIRAINPNIYFIIAVLSIGALLLYGFKEVFPDRPVKNVLLDKPWKLYIAVGAVGLITVVTVTLGTVARYRTYTASNFDFGLFCQMFESMATDFTQNTTLERNKLLSHFAVHFSPIYYVLLPFYMIFRCPEFLLAAQATVCFSALIPLVLICRKKHYDSLNILLISVAFAALPFLTGGCFYDFHENAFLPPLILWLMYFLETKKLPGIIVFTLLLLCVKEDAGLYVICIGIYALLNKSYPKINGILVLVLGIFGFIGVTAFIDSFGEGIKTSRYQLFLTEGQKSLTDVIINVLKNPAFMLSKLLSPEKIIFLVYVTVPMGFLCFRTRRLCDYALFLPLLLINLATDYSYQYDVNFQYVFGTGTILAFLFARNLRYVRKKRKLLVFAAAASVILCFAANGGRYRFSFEEQRFKGDIFAQTDRVLAELPNDASIISTTYLIPHLYDNKEVYMYPYDGEYTDFVVLDNRSNRFTGFDEEVEKLLSMGYTLYREQGYATIYVSPDYKAEMNE